MIRAIGKNERNTPIVMLGLSMENINKLKEDEPIRVNIKNLVPGEPPTNLPDIDILIFVATPESLDALTKAAGLNIPGGING